MIFIEVPNLKDFLVRPYEAVLECDQSAYSARCIIAQSGNLPLNMLTTCQKITQTCSIRVYLVIILV